MPPAESLRIVIYGEIGRYHISSFPVKMNNYLKQLAVNSFLEDCTSMGLHQYLCGNNLMQCHLCLFVPQMFALLLLSSFDQYFPPKTF